MSETSNQYPPSVTILMLIYEQLSPEEQRQMLSRADRLIEDRQGQRVPPPLEPADPVLEQIL